MGIQSLKKNKTKKKLENEKEKSKLKIKKKYNKRKILQVKNIRKDTENDRQKIKNGKSINKWRG